MILIRTKGPDFFVSAFSVGRVQIMPARGVHKLLCARGEQKGGAMFLFERSERQKPRSRPAGVCRQANDRKASTVPAHFTTQALSSNRKGFFVAVSPIQERKKKETLQNAGNTFFAYKTLPQKATGFLCYRLTIFSKRKNSSRPKGFSPSCIW